MSTELRLKKLRGSGGFVMASVNDQQQMKGNQYLLTFGPNGVGHVEW